MTDRLDKASRMPHPSAAQSLGAAASAWRDRQGLLVLLGALVAPSDARERIEAAMPEIESCDPEMARLIECVLRGDGAAAWRCAQREIGYRPSDAGLFQSILDTFRLDPPGQDGTT